MRLNLSHRFATLYLKAMWACEKLAIKYPHMDTSEVMDRWHIWMYEQEMKILV